MASSQSPAFRSDCHPHLHVAEQQCPFCGQDIPEEKLEEISGRIAAREQERLSEALARLREQHSLEKTQAEAKATGELEQARREAAEQTERLKTEAGRREAAAREQARKEAEEAAAATLAAAQTAREEKEAELAAKIAEEAGARKSAEEASAALTLQLGRLRMEKDAAIAKAAADAAEREKLIRAEAATAAEEAMKERLAAAEEAKQAAERAKAEAEGTLRAQLTAATEQIQALKENHAGEINSQREALEKGKEAALNAERARNLEEKMRLERKLSDMQRQLQQKTADEHGQGAELELHQVLKGEFEEDRIRRVQKGTAGADIIHEVVHNGKLCGKIVYDSKNRSAWRSEYATKLRADQIAERADHAVLSTKTFPSGSKQLHIQEHVIIACPARAFAASSATTCARAARQTSVRGAPSWTGRAASPRPSSWRAAGSIWTTSATATWLLRASSRSPARRTAGWTSCSRTSST